MICQRCTRLLSRKTIPYPSFRVISTTSVRTQPEPVPPATSTSSAQPFSTPFTPSPSKTPTISPNDKASASQGILRSSVAAGTPLKGLGFIKGQDAPLAKEDADYPSWLWSLLGTGEKGGEAETVGDAFAKSKKQRRLASKAARALKTGMVGTSHVVKVPLEEQSINLPAGLSEDETGQAQDAREELNAAMRKARRRRIKESNFLRGMR